MFPSSEAAEPGEAATATALWLDLMVAVSSVGEEKSLGRSSFPSWAALSSNLWGRTAGSAMGPHSWIGHGAHSRTPIPQDGPSIPMAITPKPPVPPPSPTAPRAGAGLLGGCPRNTLPEDRPLGKHRARQRSRRLGSGREKEHQAHLLLTGFPC